MIVKSPAGEVVFISQEFDTKLKRMMINLYIKNYLADPTVCSKDDNNKAARYEMKSMYIFLARLSFVWFEPGKLAIGVSDVTNTVTAKATTCSFVCVNTRSPWEETCCEHSLRKSEQIIEGEVFVGNRQLAGVMATADWHNRLLSHRERRGGMNRMRRRYGKRGGRDENKGRWKVEEQLCLLLVLLPRYRFLSLLLCCSNEPWLN